MDGMIQQPDTDLFPVAQSLSPRLQWIERHGIETQHMRLEWVAWTNADNPLGYCKGSGATEDEALTELAKAAGIRMWHEEAQ